MVDFVYLYSTSTNYIIFFCKDKKGAMIDMVGDVDDGLEKITAMSSTKAGWAKTVGKLVEDVEQGVVSEMNLKSALLIINEPLLHVNKQA